MSLLNWLDGNDRWWQRSISHRIDNTYRVLLAFASEIQLGYGCFDICMTNTLLQNVSPFVCPLVDYKSRSHGKSNVYAVYQGSRPKVVRLDRVNWQFV